MIHFQLTPFDIFEFNQHFMKKNANFLQKYIHWILMGFFVLLMLFMLHHNGATGLSYLMVSILVVAMVFIQKAFTQFLRRKTITNYLKKNPQVIEDRSLSFNNKEVVLTINGKETKYPLNDFTLLEETKYHYFAYLNQESAVILPKRLEKKSDEILKMVEKIKASL